MIIDLILDRKDGKPYDPAAFYRDVAGYGGTWPDIADPITAAMDYGTDADVKRALCEYVRAGEYSAKICDYVQRVTWLYPDALPLNPICTGCKARGTTCNGTTCQTWTGCVYRKI